MKTNKHQPDSHEHPSAGLPAKKKDKLQLLIGSWIVENGDTTYMFNIEQKKNRIVIRSMDMSRGVYFKIGKTKWDGNELSFALKESAGGYKADCVIKPLSSNKFLQKVILKEYWKKLSDSEAFEILDTAVKTQQRLKRPKGGREGIALN